MTEKPLRMLSLILRVELYDPSFEDRERRTADMAAGLLASLEESATARLVQPTLATIPDPAIGREVFAVFVSAFVDMEVWNRELGPGQSADDVANHLGGILGEWVRSQDVHPQVTLNQVVTHGAILAP